MTSRISGISGPAAKVAQAVVYASLALGLASQALASEASWELHRVTVVGTGADQVVYRCHIRPGVIDHYSEVAGLQGIQSAPFTIDEAAVQKLAEAAPGIAEPAARDGSAPHTDWWVRSNSTQLFKMLRTKFAGQTAQDGSDAGKALTALLGASCTKFFGE